MKTLAQPPGAQLSSPRCLVLVCAGLSDLLGPASQMVIVGERDNEEEYATEEEEDGSIWKGANFH